MHTLEQLRSGALAGTRQLKLNARLTHFPPEILDLADTLEVLDLSHNQLDALPPDFGRLRKLRVFFASWNRFEVLPDVLGECPQLSQVGLRNNRIHTLPAAALPPRLRWLTLTDNQLRQLPAELGECPALEKLMLSGNQLQTLPETLAGLPALALLRIAANRIGTLPGWLWQMPALAWLAGAGNPWCGPPSPGPDAPVIDWADLTLGPVLGEGASGVTHRARWQPAAAPVDAGRDVAVKLFRGQLTSDGLPESEQAASLAAGPHPALCGALGRLAGHPQGLAGLVMPLMPEGLHALAGPPSLASCSRDVYAPALRLPGTAALRLLTDAAQALAHLHAHGVLHGDVYAHNLLWRPATGQAVLSDFGAALRWPAAQAACWPQAQRLEVLAFGHLLEEVLAHLDDTAEATLAPALRHWQQRCADRHPARRPLMGEVAAALAALSGLASTS